MRWIPVLFVLVCACSRAVLPMDSGECREAVLYRNHHEQLVCPHARHEIQLIERGQVICRCTRGPAQTAEEPVETKEAP